jgi:hypothetical protein
MAGTGGDYYLESFLQSEGSQVATEGDRYLLRQTICRHV